jgi:uracil-DNA glycosylase family 4
MDELREILKFYGDMGAEFLHLPGSDPRADLAELNRQILQCRRCRLHESKTHYVPGEGNNRPDILFVGEGPGETEDQFGRPFIGKAGQLLDKIIQKMGLGREDVFIGNVVKCRPPNNREPLKDEVEACLPYLLKQVEILKPKVIVWLLPTYHPAYILHKKNKEEISRAKWEVWEDMQKVLALIPGKRP